MALNETQKQMMSLLIQRLPEQQRLVLSLYYCEDLTFAEMGRILDLTPPQACRLYCQAFNRLWAEGRFRH